MDKAFDDLSHQDKVIAAALGRSGFWSSESMDAIQCIWSTLRRCSPNDCFAVRCLWPRWINLSPRDGFLRLGIWPVSVGLTFCRALGQFSEAFQRGKFTL
jgi:hypothetical protein